mmetsp:Transcript_5709/g.8276  ORF Transcript_5709/g.8276 Transcript_5709/m.8276 type:complete len:123 (-) Transcript_5709:57-425(-)
MRRSLSKRSDPSLSERKEEIHPFQGWTDSVEDVTLGAMSLASAALTAREAMGMTFLAVASATFLMGADIFGVYFIQFSNISFVKKETTWLFLKVKTVLVCLFGDVLRHEANADGMIRSLRGV